MKPLMEPAHVTHRKCGQPVMKLGTVDDEGNETYRLVCAHCKLNGLMYEACDDELPSE
jgi:hypothetical protein